MQQHRQAVRATCAGFVCCANKRTFRRPIHTVEHHVVRRERSGRNRHGIARVHSQRRGINDQVDVCELCPHCGLVPRHSFETRDGTEHARSRKERTQPLYKCVCLRRRAIHQDQALAIFQRALASEGMTCPPAGRGSSPVGHANRLRIRCAPLVRILRRRCSSRSTFSRRGEPCSRRRTGLPMLPRRQSVQTPRSCEAQ